MCIPFVGDWHYYHRKRGMQTSSDDILLAAAASFPHLVFGCNSNAGANLPPPIERYLDMGCGIGSSLLLVAYNSRPSFALGVEVQQASFQMVSRSIAELPPPSFTSSSPHPRLEALHGDLRSVLFTATFDTITANPPYLPADSGTVPQDPQRRGARFEMHGGVEDYCKTAARILSPAGRFLLAFWHRDRARVERAAALGGLGISRRLDVIGGAHGRVEPHLSIWELRLLLSPTEPPAPFPVHMLDITRTLSGGLNPNYRAIQAALNMRARPLK